MKTWKEIGAIANETERYNTIKAAVLLKAYIVDGKSDPDAVRVLSDNVELIRARDELGRTDRKKQAAERIRARLAAPPAYVLAKLRDPADSSALERLLEDVRTLVALPGDKAPSVPLVPKGAWTVRRYDNGKLVKEYGSFTDRELADRVAQTSAEKYPEHIVIVCNVGDDGDVLAFQRAPK